jgi:hypothetical protein
MVQSLRGSDDVEMTRQERQRLDLADDMPVSSEARWESSHHVDRAIDAEHLMPGGGQHRGESAAACSDIENPRGPLADHPSGRSFWIGIPPRRHGGNFSGA